jgi:hypothetical protein
MPEKEVSSRKLLPQKGKHNFLHFLWQYFWWKKSCIFSNYFKILMKLCFFVVHIHVKKKRCHVSNVTWSQETSWSGPRSSLNQLDPVGDEAEIPTLEEYKKIC